VFFPVVTLLTIPLLLIWIVTPASATTFWWDWANASGYVAVLVMLLLFLYPAQLKSETWLGGFSNGQLHQELGYAALLITALHILLLLFSEPLLLEHLKPTAPWYMLCGLLATLLLVLMITVSMPISRKRLWTDHRCFRTVHRWLALVTLLLLFAHVLGSRFYLNSTAKQALFVLLAAATVSPYLCRWRQSKKTEKYVPSPLRPEPVGRWVSVGSVMVALLVAFLLVIFNSLTETSL